MRRIVTARDQVQMLAPWRAEQYETPSVPRYAAFLKEARYPQVWSPKAPYGYLPSGRARNRPPSVLRDPKDPSAGVLDPSEIRYVNTGDSVSAMHPNGDHMGSYAWDEADYDHPAHITLAQIDPRYQGQGVAGGIIDHIREHHEPDLVHSGYRGRGSLSYQGRAGALRDLGNTEEEHNDYFNITPFNYGSSEPAAWRYNITDEQRAAHAKLVEQFEEDRKHPNFTGRTSENPHDPDLMDEYGDRHEYGYDADGDYVGLSNGGKNSEGYNEEGYDYRGYDADGYDRGGLDEEGYDQEGYHDVTGLNRDGETRHGYVPGDGTPPEGTVPMSQMSTHWHEQGLPKTPEQEQMIDDVANTGVAPTMYAVRHPFQRSSHDGTHHVGNGDTLYSSLERARESAYHPERPHMDRDIVKVDDLNPDHLHTDETGQTPDEFHYAPPSTDWDAEDTASTEATVVQDPVRHQRILGDLGHGWNQGTLDYSPHPSFEYQDPNGGRSGRIYQGEDGRWTAEHMPEFGAMRRGKHDYYHQAADAVREGTRPGPTMEQHALEINNNYHTSGSGAVDWEPHPNGQGLMAHTPHGDLHLVQNPQTGYWDYHAGPHGSQPGDEGTRRSMLSDSLPRTAVQGIRSITEYPFHGGLIDELGEGWGPHPRSAGAYSRRLPSGNHAYVAKNPDGTYGSGIQRDNGNGSPSTSLAYRDDMPDLSQALAFIHHRENPVPSSALGEGWEDLDRGRQHFPTYIHESHPSGAVAHVAWNVQNGMWRTQVNHHNGLETYESGSHKTPQDAAAWANSLMDDLGNNMGSNKPTASL